MNHGMSLVATSCLNRKLREYLSTYIQASVPVDSEVHILYGLTTLIN